MNRERAEWLLDKIENSVFLDLNEWEQEFIQSLSEQLENPDKEPSDKQMEVLERIDKKCSGPAPF